MSKAYRKKRHHGRDRHHNVARQRGGGHNVQNLILLDKERHMLLHKIFGNRTIREIINVLRRLDSAKGNQGKTHAGIPVMASVEILLETKEES